MKNKIETKILNENVQIISQEILIECDKKKNFAWLSVSALCFIFSVLSYLGALSSTIYYNLYTEKNINNVAMMVVSPKTSDFEKIDSDRDRISFISLDNDTSVSLK